MELMFNAFLVDFCAKQTGLSKVLKYLFSILVKFQSAFFLACAMLVAWAPVSATTSGSSSGPDALSSGSQFNCDGDDLIRLEYSDFSNLVDLQLNGATSSHSPNTDNVLRLTDGFNQSGSAFAKDAIPLTIGGTFFASFSASFEFQISNPDGISDSDGQGADGLVFILQTVSNNVGGSGGGIGFSGIDRSLGIEFDTYDNGGGDQNNGNHVGINFNGSVASALVQPIPERLNDGQKHYVWVDYNGETQVLEVRLSTDDTRPIDPTIVANDIDLPSVLASEEAFIGFSSGTAAATGRHDILNFKFINRYAPDGACDNRAPKITSEPKTTHILQPVVGDSELVDLTAWEVIQFPGGDSGANWVISDDGTEVTQRINANPSIFLSDFTLSNGKTSGRFKVTTTSDDDFIGFVFGYQDTSNFYLFDWKQAIQGTSGGRASVGMKVKRFGGTELPVFWPDDPPGDAEVLYSNQIPWADRVEYEFLLKHFPGEFEIVITRVDTGDVLDTIRILDDTYPSGGFGFYNFSQSSVNYKGFDLGFTSSREYRYQVTAEDPDNDKLEFFLITSPAGMMIDAESGLIKWVTTSVDVGVHPIEIEVRDGKGGVDRQSYNLTVTNSVPEIKSEPVLSAQTGRLYRYDVEAVDPTPNDVLIYSLEAAPRGVTVDPNTGVVEWVPSASDLGNQKLSIKVEDKLGGFDIQSFEVSVDESSGNASPVISTTAGELAQVGFEYRYDVVASDPEGSSINYSLVSAPSGMRIDAKDGVIAWVPNSSQVGDHFVNIRVNDGADGYAAQYFTVSVIASSANAAPTISSTPPSFVLKGTQYNYQVVASDSDGDSISYQLLEGPPGMIVSSSGLLTWVAQETPGVTVKLRAIDGSAYDEQEWILGSSDGVLRVSLEVTPAVVEVDEPVRVRVTPGAAPGALTTSLLVDGSAVALDANLQAVVSSSEVGEHSVLATVSNGLTEASDTKSFVVIDDSDLDPEMPFNVLNLRYEITDKGVFLNWEPPRFNLDSVTSYQIFLDQQLVSEVAADEFQVQLQDLQPQSLYSVLIKTTNKFNKASEGATTILVTPFPNPADVVATERDRSVLLSWTPIEPSDGIARYNVYVSESNFSDISGLTPAMTVSGVSASALVSGLENNRAYYVAVTTETLGGHQATKVEPLKVTPMSDSEPPEIGLIKLGELPLAEGSVISESGILCVPVDDNWAVSRVAFTVGGRSIGVDSESSDGFCIKLLLEPLEDGVKELRVAAFDTSENSAEKLINVDIQLAVPATPSITSPGDASVHNKRIVRVKGQAQFHSEVQALVNDVESNWSPVTPTGDFEFDVALEEGDNALAVKARNRAGMGQASVPINVTFDSMLPAKPLGLRAVPKQNGVILLSWSPGSGNSVDGFHLYRSKSAFEDIASAEKINQKLIKTTAFEDVLETDEQYFYRVISVNKLGTPSEPSSLIDAVSDNSAPTAKSIVYSMAGAFDSVNQVYGRGLLSVEVEVSEPLLTTPFFSITPDGGSPFSISLQQDSSNRLKFRGSLPIDESVESGDAYAVFSARDLVGNRGTEVESGAQIRIDTAGPKVIGIETLPNAPIQNDSTSSVEVTANIVLDEPIGGGATLQASYLLSGGNREAVSISNISQLEQKRWQLKFQLPADAGENAPESLSFQFNLTDELGNPGGNIAPAFSAQVYQGELPPLEAPFNVRAKAMPGGKVKLNWSAVVAASAYQLYRKGPNDVEFVEYLRIEKLEEYTDVTENDGEYQYQLASVRTANDTEALSARSEIVKVTTDSEKPAAPVDFQLELVSIGVHASWQKSAESGITYRLYRADAEPDDISDLSPVYDEISDAQVIDSQPDQATPVYVVTAVDSAGNESLPSEAQYLNVDLLPVSSLSVAIAEDSKPVLRWNHSSDSITKFDVYIGVDESGVKLNDQPVSAKEYVDSGYANKTRQYAVVAIDENGKRSLPRTITLPELELSLAKDVAIKRNLINSIGVEVKNYSPSLIKGARVKILFNDKAYVSDRVSLQANGHQKLKVNFPGLADLPDLLDIVVELESEPNSGESVIVSQSAQMSVIDGALGVDLEVGDFARGGEGPVKFTLRNTGEEDLQLVTATNNTQSDSPDVVFTVYDNDGNAIALAPFRQALGAGVVTKPSGETIATIPAGGSWVSDDIRIFIPESASDEVSLLLQINKLYVDRGSEKEVNIKGPRRQQRLNLVETPYYGQIDNVSPKSSFVRQPIKISGKAVDRASESPMGGVDLTLVIANAGFEREYEVLTDTAGNFEFTYEPQHGESGRFIVSALHPQLGIRPAHAEFVIGRLRVTPDQFKLRLPYLLDYAIPLKFQAGDGSKLTNLRFAAVPADQPSGDVPSGITLTYPTIAELDSAKSLEQEISLKAEQDAVSSGEIIISVFSNESPNDALTKIEIQYELSEARAALVHSPAVLEMGTTLAGSASGTIVLDNQGTLPVEDAQVAIKATDGLAGPSWLTLVTPKSLGNIEVGQKVNIDLSMQPQGNAIVGVEQLYLEVSSANTEPYLVPIYTAIAEDGEGGALFKVTDMYTGTLGVNGRVIQGLEGASIRLQNEAIPELQFLLSSDANGEALMEDIPAGRYSVWVNADGYQESHQRIRIQPGLISSQQIFLDYSLIKLDWSVREITLEDRYQVTLNATFETDVPAAVVMLEPTNVPMPDMKPGEVFYGELTLTNYGLIRAFDVNFVPPQSDQYYQFEYMASAVPDTLEAKQIVTIPYKITAIKPFSRTKPSDGLPDDDNPGGGVVGNGNSCGDYVRCAQADSKSRCPTGTSRSASQSCWVIAYGRCPSSGGGALRWLDLPYGRGAGFWKPHLLGLPPCRGDGDCGTGNGPGGG